MENNVNKPTSRRKQTIPYHNPGYPIHGIVIEVFVYRVELTHEALGISSKRQGMEPVRNRLRQAVSR